jgi:hypothetical protein
MANRVTAFDDVAEIARDARKRMCRVTWFFHGLFALSIGGAIALDMQPPNPKLECHKESAQMMSPYPHPYGLPPVGTWTVCEWR